MLEIAIDQGRTDDLVMSAALIHKSFPRSLLDARGQLAAADAYAASREWRKALRQYQDIERSFRNISHPYVLLSIAECQRALGKQHESTQIYSHLLRSEGRTTVFWKGKPCSVGQLCLSALLQQRK